MTDYYEHPQYRFECLNADGDRTEMEFTAEKLSTVTGKFVDFLKASGFSYVTGISVLSKGNDNNPTNWNYHFDERGEYEHPPVEDLMGKLEEKVANE